MELYNILSDSEFLELSDSECVAKLDEDVDISKDETYYTWTTANRQLLKNGLDAGLIAVWNTAIEGIVGASMLDKMLSSTGVNFSLPEVRGLIVQAIDSTDNEIAISALQACLDIGIKRGKAWYKYGLGELPSESDISEARVIIKNKNDASSLLNECINPLISEFASLEEIKLAVAAWGE